MHRIALKGVGCRQHASFLPWDPVLYRETGFRVYTQFTKPYSMASRMPWADFCVIPRKSQFARTRAGACPQCHVLVSIFHKLQNVWSALRVEKPPVHTSRSSSIPGDGAGWACSSSSCSLRGFLASRSSCPSAACVPFLL